jgi:hypothetical protein
MKKLNKIQLILISSLLLLFAFSCRTSSTMITGTWEREGIEKDYNHILVASLSTNVNLKASMERAMEQSLREKGVEASQSIDLIPPKFVDDEDQKRKIINAIRDDGVDAILTVSIIDKDTETRYTPGSAAYAPYPRHRFYGNFWGYYNHWYPRFYTPGYYSEDKIYFIETNLYDAETEDLIWSAQSQTYNPTDIESLSRDFVEEIVGRLAEDNII